MHKSTALPPSAQRQYVIPPVRPIYLATSALDLVEVGASLAELLALSRVHCADQGEDLALWFLVEDLAPALVGSIRPAPRGATVIQLF